jgi:hypothetical protein
VSGRRRKLNLYEQAYFKKVSTAVEYAHHFAKNYIQDQDFFYLDVNLTNPTDNYSLFKKSLRMYQQSILERINAPVFGVIERPTSKPFHYHAHIVIAKNINELNETSLKKTGFIVKKNKPNQKRPYQKFHYLLKISKFNSWLKTKPYKESGSYFFFRNAPELPRAKISLPKSYFTPKQLKQLLQSYFWTAKMRADQPMISLFEFAEGIKPVDLEAELAYLEAKRLTKNTNLA